jgi:hypothetical protein
MKEERQQQREQHEKRWGVGFKLGAAADWQRGEERTGTEKKRRSSNGNVIATESSSRIAEIRRSSNRNASAAESSSRTAEDRRLKRKVQAAEAAVEGMS